MRLRKENIFYIVLLPLIILYIIFSFINNNLNIFGLHQKEKILFIILYFFIMLFIMAFIIIWNDNYKDIFFISEEDYLYGKNNKIEEINKLTRERIKILKEQKNLKKEYKEVLNNILKLK